MGHVHIQSVTTILEVPSSVLNWLVEPMCIVFDMLRPEWLAWMLDSDLR